MGKKLYVGNLSASMTEPSLESLFAEHGSVSSVHLILDRETGCSKGFAFVEMANVKDANAAIDALNLKEVEGHTIKVDEARPRTDRSEGKGRGGPGAERRRW